MFSVPESTITLSFLGLTLHTLKDANPLSYLIEEHFMVVPDIGLISKRDALCAALSSSLDSFLTMFMCAARIRFLPS